MKFLLARLATIGSVLLLAVPLTPAVPTAQVDPVHPYRAGDRSLTALNILPPGQGKYMNAEDLATAQAGGPQYVHNDDQLAMYDDMVQAAPNVTEADLQDLFKDASFGVQPGDVERQYSPKQGVTILRDKGFGVPHVYGVTRSDTMYGVGYVSAEDRLFMMDVLRNLGRGRVSELAGATASNLKLDRDQRAVADYSEAEFTAMLDRAAGLGPQGAIAKQDIIDFTAGVNRFIDEALADPEKLPGEYPALQITPEPWIPEDSVAVASVIGASLGVGGGREVENARFLTDLVDLGMTQSEAKDVYDDLRFRNDPEAPVKTHGVAFPWPGAAADPWSAPSVALPDDAQAVLDSALASSSPIAVDGPFGDIPISFPEGASNALLVGPSLSASGRPLAVFGPQTGYWSPEILMEIDMHGPGLHGRGAAFPGVSLYVLLGRGEDYAWSATSAGADQVDIFAVELCDPGILDGDPNDTVETTDNHYLGDDGECRDMIDTGISYLAKPNATAPPELVEIPTWRIDLDFVDADPGADPVADATSDPPGLPSQGIVAGRGEIGGVPHAFARLRSSYGGEVDSAVTYVDIMDPDSIEGATDFQDAFGKFNFTFNWFFAGREEIAWQLGGDHPLRAPGTNPDFPILNSPANRWAGVLPQGANPNAINPPEGYIVSWNNKQAPGFEAADNEWSYGPVHRSQPLEERMLDAAKDDGKISVVELVNAMGDAATVDLRGDKVLPFVLEVIGGGDTALQDAALDLLRAWHASGAHRRDRNLDGTYEHSAAIALMDALWEPLLAAIFQDDIGDGNPATEDAYDHFPEGMDNAPGPNGSAYLNGWYGQAQKALRQALGKPIALPYSTSYCGAGVLADCRDAVLGALDDAITAVGDLATATADPADDEINYAALGVQDQPNMQWQNRPTFQQVVEFGDVCPGFEGVPGLHVLGTEDDDVLEGSDGPDLLCGFDGDDTLRGGDGDDLILGGAGDDILEGGSGADAIEGESGEDLLRGGAGDDDLDGGTGADVLAGEGGRDRLEGGNGKDVLRGGSGRDILLGQRKRDTLRGQNGNDVLRGANGHDKLVGGRGKDTANGGGGNDILRGGKQRDTLRGGKGKDTLNGGKGNDTLNGGKGTDLCKGGSGNDSLRGCEQQL